MSFELTSLKFNVDTGALLEAIVQVDKLGTSVAKLTAPLKTLETTTTAVAKATKDNASATTAQVAATDAQTAATSFNELGFLLRIACSSCNAIMCCTIARR